MSQILRKKLWNQFYALVIVDILTCNDIQSQTLKNILSKVSGINLYLSLVEDLNIFFQSADMNYLIILSYQIINEQISKSTADDFVDSIFESS